MNSDVSYDKDISIVNNQSYRLILLWTNLFNDVYWHQESFFNLSKIISCSSMHRCQFTRNKSKLSEASVVAFHLYDLKRYQLPERIYSKNDNQSWIFITGESPINFYYQNPSFYPHILDHHFDQSISYDYNSQFLIFSRIVKLRSLSYQQSQLSSLLTVERQREQQLNLNSLKYKKKPIVWIASNCITFSRRENYVQQLKEFIQIDIYGTCGISCSNNINRTCEINLHEYYFYLALVTLIFIGF